MESFSTSKMITSSAITNILLRPKRSENFSLPEIIFILDRIKIKGDMLFHSATNPHRRSKGWEEIILELHQAHPNWPLRNEHQLRNWWRKAKTYARKYHYWKVTGKGFQVGFKRAETVPKMVLDIIQQYESPENTFPSETTLTTTANSYEASYTDDNVSDNIAEINEINFNPVKTEFQDDCIVVSSSEEQPGEPKIESKRTISESFEDHPPPEIINNSPINNQPPISPAVLMFNRQYRKRHLLPKSSMIPRPKHARSSLLNEPPISAYTEAAGAFSNGSNQLPSNSYSDTQLPVNGMTYFSSPQIFPYNNNSSTPNFNNRNSPRTQNRWNYQEKPFETVRIEWETMRHKKEMELLDFKLKAAYEEHSEKMKYLHEKQRQLLLKRDNQQNRFS